MTFQGKLLVSLLLVSILYSFEAFAGTQNVALHRSKRSLTTICVEIRPSTPQEEPYFMCKGTDFPSPQLGSATRGSSIRSNSDNNSKNIYGSNFQNPPYTFQNNARSRDTLGYGEFQSSFQNAEPSVQQIDNPTSIRHTEVPFEYPQHTSFQNYKPAFQVPPALSQFDRAPTTFRFEGQQLPKFSYNEPRQSSSPKSAISFRSGANLASESLHHSEPNVQQPSAEPVNAALPQTQSSNFGEYARGQQSKTNTSSAPFRSFQHAGPATTNYGRTIIRPFAQPSIAPPHQSALADQSGVTQRFSSASEDASPQNAQWPATAQKSSTSSNPYVAAAIPKSTTSNLMPDIPHFGEDKHRNWKPQNYYRTPAEPILSSPPNWMTPTERRGPTALTKEELVSTPSWGFAPEELQVFRTIPNNEDYAMNLEPLKDGLTMPLSNLDEYHNDPVMQQFYASLQNQPVVGSEMKKPPLQSKVIPQSSNCEDCTSYQCKTQKPEQYLGTPPARVPQSYDANLACNSYPPTGQGQHACFPRDYGLQPIFIALPCLDQQRTLPANVAGYDNVGMARPLARLLTRPFTPFATPFAPPLIPNFFNPFNLLAAPQSDIPVGSMIHSSQPEYVNPSYRNSQTAQSVPLFQLGLVPSSTVQLKDMVAARPTKYTTEHVSKKQDNIVSDAHDERAEKTNNESNEDEKSQSEEVAATSAAITKETPSAQAETQTKTKNSEQISAATTTARSDDNSFEVSRKTYQVMLGAAKSLTNIAKTEFPSEVTSSTEGRIEKRQNPLKSSTTNTGGSKRKYVQKL